MYLVGYSNYFLTGCGARGLKPLPISRDFSPQKTADVPFFFFFNFRKISLLKKRLMFLFFFFLIFANRDLFLRVFLPQSGRFLQLFCNFCEMGPSSKDFFDQNGTHV